MTCWSKLTNTVSWYTTDFHLLDYGALEWPTINKQIIKDEEKAFCILGIPNRHLLYCTYCSENNKAKKIKTKANIFTEHKCSDHVRWSSFWKCSHFRKNTFQTFQSSIIRQVTQLQISGYWREVTGVVSACYSTCVAWHSSHAIELWHVPLFMCFALTCSLR